MNVPLKILHIGNGRSFKIRTIVDALLRRGLEIHMVPIPPTEESWGDVNWHCLPKPLLPGPAKVLVRLAQVRQLARKLRPDIVHAHNAWGPGWYGAITGLHPLVIHAYGGDLLPEQYEGRPAMQRRLTSWACRCADRVIVTGQHMTGAAERLKIPHDRLLLLPRGVDLERYRPGLDTAGLRRSLGIGDSGPILLSPRYQVDESLYNLDIVMESFVTVRSHFPKAICLQLFDPQREHGAAHLARAAQGRGLEESYRLIPAVDNALMPGFYNLADAVISVPSSDGFPVTVLEASACGTPLVVSRLPYCGEWFVEGVNGLIVPPRDAGALAAALIALCEDAAMRERFGTAGRLQVEKRADYERCMDRLETEYRMLLAATRPATVGNT